MKTVKLFFAIIVLTLTVTVANATTGLTRAMIQKKSETTVTLKAQLEADETMFIVITNENGDVVHSDEIQNINGLIQRNYDFSEARFGGYFMEVFIDDELIKATVIGDKKVTTQDSYFLELY
jgi:hypothetical protein